MRNYNRSGIRIWRGVALSLIVFSSILIALGQAITHAQAQPTLSASSPVAPGTSVTATWSGIPNPTSHDWIALYASPDAIYNDFLSYCPQNVSGGYGCWVYTNGQASGSIQLLVPSAAPAGSTYQLRLWSNNSYTLLATSNLFTVSASVTPTPTLTPIPSVTPTPRPSGVMSPRFASAGPAGGPFASMFYYQWSSIRWASPPDNTNPQSFMWLVGKLDNGQSDACGPCSNAQIIRIFQDELPVITTLLTHSVNLGNVWQVGNEPNCCPSITAQQYAMQFDLYADAIKALDPTAQMAGPPVLMVGWSGAACCQLGAAESYTDAVLAALPSSEWPDIFTPHYYPSGTDQATYQATANEAQGYKSYLVGKGLGTKPVWVTEFGQNISSASRNDAVAFMDALVPVFEQGAADRWFWFIGTVEHDSFDNTALTDAGSLTAVGQEYQNLGLVALSSAVRGR